MSSNAISIGSGESQLPKPRAVLELLKPITWFPPMWAFACGAISVGGATLERWPYVLLGILLAGPLVCGTSQAINDWYDREVDAINEPHRVIPSGRMPGRWGLYIALGGSAISMLVALVLGPVVTAAAAIGLVFAWAYSMPPFRLKENGWLGNATCGFAYESLPWITAAAAATQVLPTNELLAVALLYGLGAHGIMTLNDFKAIEGDRKLGIRSLPVQLGPIPAARIAAATMALSQAAVIAILFTIDAPVAASLVAALLTVQLVCMTRLVTHPIRYAVWYSAIGVGLYVTGMMITAIALALIGGA
ncbi:MAG: chlorophyll synthase ChlG [Pseudomonadota bacterium]